MAPARIKDFKELSAFLRDAGFCLRYWGNDSLPIASMYEAVLGKQRKPSTADQKFAIQLTNQLLERHEAIEVNVIADRVCLVHRSIMPTLYSLVKEKSKSGAIPELSREAKEVLSLIQEKGQIVTGDVRELLGIPSTKTSDDPAYVVLNELQRHLLIDRGPFKISNQAIPYLAKEGYPYHLFEEAHLELAKEGEEIKADQARNQWLMAFLKSRGECSLRKMGSIFKVFLTKAEIERSVQELVSARKLKIQKGKATPNASVMF